MRCEKCGGTKFKMGEALRYDCEVIDGVLKCELKEDLMEVLYCPVCKIDADPGDIIIER